MHVYEQDQSEITRRRTEVRRQESDVDAQAARRAAAAGRVNSVEHGAVLRLQRLAGNAGVSSLVGEDEAQRSPVLDVVGKGGGSALPTNVRAEMETGLGADFGDVRVHDDGAAASSAQAVQAKAYTVGNEIVFNRGAYEPDSATGRQTLAHELTHVVQQRSGPVDGTATGDGIALSHPEDRFEQEAEASAASYARGEAVNAPAASGAATIQREETEEAEDVRAQAIRLQREEEAAAPEEEEDMAAQTMSLQREDEMEEEPEAG